MGYRSYGFFAFPKKYLPELERRFQESDINWILDENNNINMGNFEDVETFDDPNGYGEMLKIRFSDWKWWSGADAAGVIESFLYEMDHAWPYDSPEQAREETFKELQIIYPLRFINYSDLSLDNVMQVNTYEEPYAFVRIGDDFGDTEVASNMYNIYAKTYIDNHPFTDNPPVTTIIIDVASKEESLVKKICHNFLSEFGKKIEGLTPSHTDFYDKIDGIIRSYNPYVKTGEPPKPKIYNKAMYFGWHTSYFANPESAKALDLLVGNMQKWASKMTNPRDSDAAILLSAFTFLEDPNYEPIYHGRDDLDFEMSPYYDLDIFLSNDYESEI